MVLRVEGNQAGLAYTGFGRFYKGASGGVLPMKPQISTLFLSGTTSAQSSFDVSVRARKDQGAAFGPAVQSGWHKLQWQGKDKYQRSVASGVYFYTVKTGKQKITNKMLLLK